MSTSLLRADVEETKNDATGTAGEVERLTGLHAEGVLSDAEFEQAKVRALA